MFVPPRCPYRRCSQHRDPQPRFCTRFGTYQPRCRPHPVQRFRCRACRRTFSRQTFRADYRDHRPHLNAELFAYISSGVGIRETARKLGLSRRCTELKLRKLSRHLRRLNLNLRQPLPAEASFCFDELESFEGQRNTRPLTVPVLIETESRFIVWAESATIRPSGRMTEKRRKAVERAEKRYGVRRNRSRRAVRRALQRGADIAQELAAVKLRSDEKSTYPGLAKAVFGKQRLVHQQTNSKLARTTWNPLFPINHEEAVMRDLMGRLRRQSWLVSKARRYLDLALQVHMAYRNYVRRRFNKDAASPAQLLGFVPRRLTAGELLSWRQDWRAGSIHPLSRSGRTLECWRESASSAA